MVDYSTECQFCSPKNHDAIYPIINLDKKSITIKPNISLSLDLMFIEPDHAIISADLSSLGDVLFEVEKEIFFCPFCGRHLYKDIEQTKGYCIDIIDMELKPRTYNALRRAGIKTVSGILNRTSKQLREIHGFGINGLNNVENQLYLKYGLRLKDRKDDYIPEGLKTKKEDK